MTLTTIQEEKVVVRPKRNDIGFTNTEGFNSRNLVVLLSVVTVIVFSSSTDTVGCGSSSPSSRTRYPGVGPGYDWYPTLVRSETWHW